jgi:hypothetical protein
MRARKQRGLMIVAVVAVLPVMASSQGPDQTLVVTGHAGSLPLTLINGRNYVDIEALARLANVSLTFDGNQFTLTLPVAGGNARSEAGQSPTPSTGFSPEFLRAAIEAMSTVREWHSALASAIENQFPMAKGGLASYQAQARMNLRLAKTAATSDADKSAMQLMTNAFEKMNQLNDKYVRSRADMNYIAPDALKNDPLDQSLIVCGKSLGAMAASGQFTDDGSCH